MMKEIKKTAELLLESKFAISFTGAGVSQESGIPTFRDPGGIWDMVSPEEFGTPQGLLSSVMKNPEKVKNFLKKSIETIFNAKPNDGHIALAELEKEGIIKWVITQNIDNLHQFAGNKNVIELHGNLYRWRCINCGRDKKMDKEEFMSFVSRILEREPFNIGFLLEMLPRCECRGMMRIDVVLFGEPVQELDKGFKIASEADLIFVLGTSGVVYPAALIPKITKESGGKVIEINPHSPGYKSIADVYINLSFASSMPLIANEIKIMKGGKNEIPSSNLRNS